jgi:hypothetical protein
LPIAVAVDGLFFPQRIKMGFDSRQSTPGFKRQLLFVNGETRSFKRASVLKDRVHGMKVSPNTIERICKHEHGEHEHGDTHNCTSMGTHTIVDSRVDWCA